MNKHVANFYAGPGKLPTSVLKRIAAELTNYRGSGMSVMEISHRAKPIVDLIERTQLKIKHLLGLRHESEVLLLQGGGSLQFLMVPINLSALGDPVDYIDTGYWAGKAISSAREIGRDVCVIAKDHRGIPEKVECRSQAKYVHLCTNNTVMGTQWHRVPKLSVPIVADASSDFLSRSFDYGQFDLCYAHAQKTIGTSGVTVVVLKKDLLKRFQRVESQFLSYDAHIKASSNFHTPPVFAIYVVECMLDWLMDDIGGLEAMGKINQEKADLIYDFLDKSTLFKSSISIDSRSLMNVVFDMQEPEQQSSLLALAEAQGIVGLAGHRMRGGLRASIYNAVTLDEVARLVRFLSSYEARR